MTTESATRAAEAVARSKSDDEEETTLSWTSSNMSLSPENLLYIHDADSKLKEFSAGEIRTRTADQQEAMLTRDNEKESSLENRSTSQLGGSPRAQTSKLPLHRHSATNLVSMVSEGAPMSFPNRDYGSIPSTSTMDGAQSSFVGGSGKADLGLLNGASQSSLNRFDENITDYLEDSEGEPIVDESVLQSLSLSQNNFEHEDVTNEDPVMLEGGHSPKQSDDTDSSFLPPFPAAELEVPKHPLDTFPSTGSLLERHHGRQPSTILEEMTEGVRKEVEEQAYLKQPRVATSLSPPRHCRPLSELGKDRYSTGSFSAISYKPQQQQQSKPVDPLAFTPFYVTTRLLQRVSRVLLKAQHSPNSGAATWIGFWALLYVTCANYVLTPMRDAIALQVGVEYMPKLTLASTVLALFSSVPIGWLFEAPDPGRRRVWKRMGLTRGETQGTSLALFYRCFAFILVSYAVGFSLLEWSRSAPAHVAKAPEYVVFGILNLSKVWGHLGKVMYIAFFLVVHLMKLHCLSLVWGVVTEAMEYEEVARKAQANAQMESNKMRLKRLALVGFGGTLGGILGSFLASSMAQILQLPGLLLLSAFLLEISAELSIELGRIMQKHWEGQQQLFVSNCDLAGLDPSMKRSSSLGSMKRISSGNSLNRVKSTSDLGTKPLAGSSGSLSSATTSNSAKLSEDTFTQRLRRGVTTILRSRLLISIFTYNALYASTTVLLSFQRASLVANRSSTTSVQADTAFLANINMASSAAIFALQASGAGAVVAHKCGFRGTLALMPLIRLAGVLALAWWHRLSGGQPPNLLVFLVVDECCKIMNLAVAKPVRESLWRGLSNEARYEAKPVVDTLANRWGGGSAAFLVSFVDKTFDLFGVVADVPGGTRDLFGYPPVLCLCLIISSWWAVVSVDLGQIRKNIDMELKKRQ